MLKELYIENLAVIEKAVVTFDGGFNVFSGETGAGKSILIGGINAVLGERVSKDLVRAGAEKAVITALFQPTGGEELLLTREISASGNSIARINGRTTTAAELKEVSAGLIDVHGQHRTRLLISGDVQLALIDSFGNVAQHPCKSEYEAEFREFSRVSKLLKTVSRENEFREEKIEILSGKIADVEPYKLKRGEEDEVSAELNRLRNIQHIADSLNRAYSALAAMGEEFGAVELLNICKSALVEAARYVPECKELQERVAELFIEAEDIKSELSPLISDNVSTEKLPFYEERMSDFLRLSRKYSMSMDELVTAFEQWRSELEELQNSDENLQKLTDAKSALGVRVRELGAELSELRRRASDALCGQICAELAYLDMPNTQLIFALEQGKVTINGMDSAELLIAANPGEEPKPLAKTASGGELSRIMLAVKSVQACCDDVATMIFDEIDTGISGRAAHKVGLKMSELSRGRQVLCVTHLAQIAAMADNHLLIEKATHPDGRTYTAVRRIVGEERKRELARIISGDDDELSLANAERLMNRGAV